MGDAGAAAHGIPIIVATIRLNAIGIILPAAAGAGLWMGIG
jgi:hypothetical protein